MKFVTRAHARVDRIACPWLIRRFIDPNADILFVPADQVMRVAREQDATPFDVPSAELGHHGDLCSFDAFLEKFHLTDPALRDVAQIVRGADTDQREITPESAGLFAIATGFQKLSPSTFPDDHALLAAEAPLYDALYEFCRSRRKDDS
jgi:hypothetical protein